MKDSKLMNGNVKCGQKRAKVECMCVADFMCWCVPDYVLVGG